MTARIGGIVLAAAGVCGAAFADDVPIDAKPLPLATQRVPASADECDVWKREQSFARSVENHDAHAFASFLHAGTVFNAGAGSSQPMDSRAAAERWVEGQAMSDCAA